MIVHVNARTRLLAKIVNTIKGNFNFRFRLSDADRKYGW